MVFKCGLYYGWSLWYFSMAGIMAGLCGVLVWLV